MATQEQEGMGTSYPLDKLAVDSLGKRTGQLGLPVKPLTLARTDTGYV